MRGFLHDQKQTTRQPGSDTTMGIAGLLNRHYQLAPGPPDPRIRFVVIQCLI